MLSSSYVSKGKGIGKGGLGKGSGKGHLGKGKNFDPLNTVPKSDEEMLLEAQNKAKKMRDVCMSVEWKMQFKVSKKRNTGTRL